MAHKTMCVCVCVFFKKKTRSIMICLIMCRWSDLLYHRYEALNDLIIFLTLFDFLFFFFFGARVMCKLCSVFWFFFFFRREGGGVVAVGS